MIRLLKWLIFGDGHLHKWVDKDSMARYRKHTFKDEDVLKGKIYVRECEHCGEIKVVNVD